MKTHLIFIGNSFIYNTTLQEYVIRECRKNIGFIDSITYFRDGDNSLFLYLEEQLNMHVELIIVTTKQYFTTVGKLLSTITMDNQILKDGMLIPSKVCVFEHDSYLLEHKDSHVNVILQNETQKIPPILLRSDDLNGVMHIFEDTKENLTALLTPIAQTFDISISIVQIIDGWLRVDIRSKKYGNVSKFISSVQNLLPKSVIVASDVASYIIDILSKCGKKITFAESCTGGLLSYYFTSKNGASKILEGSLITYSNKLKENWLAVDENVLKKDGAVSFGTVEQMSEGALNVSDADFAISVSGIAGDSGGSEEKPVGTVFIGVRSKEKYTQVRLNLQGDRNYIQSQSVLYGVKLLLLSNRDTFFKI